ncbi:hypothetical protein QVO10_08555 [Bacteroides gallinaceum]|uniref:Transposase n=1 Tax=Bacteroides gallinaceum TaxID=1462571 RepID=A0ABT7X5S5_9BACE|nr:hypothetical protein [Bacteroides gallinaceum]MDN0049435.1 hypothetical protein [Bacteroides gallinaceum]
MKLPIGRIITGRKSYIVKTRSTVFSCLNGKKNEPTPKQIRCRLISINGFGFPSFEQVAQQEEVSLIKPVYWIRTR